MKVLAGVALVSFGLLAAVRAQQVLVHEPTERHFATPGPGVDLGRCPLSSERPFTLRCRLRTDRDAFCTPLMARDGDRVGLSLVIGRRPGTVSFEAWSWQTVRLISRSRIDDGAWHDIEVTYAPASTVALLFVDGVFEASGVLGSGSAERAQLRVGNNIGAHQPFVGSVAGLELTATTTHRELVASVQPVLPAGDYATALARLRARIMPRSTPSLAADVAGDWSARRRVVRDRVRDRLGLLPEPQRADLQVRVEHELRRDGVRLQRVTWVGFAGHRTGGWLWLPDPLPAGRRPAVLCPHGHWQHGARHPVVQARCAAFARFGWTALAVDSVHVEHVAAGVNSIGAMTWHNLRALDLLLSRDDVDPHKVAVTGASGGGQQSYYLMALEDRLCAAAPVVMACYWTEILADTSAHCGCNHTPALAAWTDVPEMCAVFAPRPVFFGSVTGDWTRNFPREGLPELRRHWLRLGGPSPGSRHGDEGHNYDRPMREAVYAFLHGVFDGGDAAPVDEPSFRVLTEQEFTAFGPSRQPHRLPVRAMADEWLARRSKVDSLAELAPGLELAVDRRAIEWRDPADRSWRRGTVTGSDGVPIPLRMRDAGDARRLVVRIAFDGVPTAGSGSPGEVVCEPRPYGGWSRFRRAWQRNGLLTGRGEGYQAAVDTALVCASLPGDAPVCIEASGERAIVAVLAAQLCDRITELDLQDLGPDFRDAGDRLPQCPEILRFGDVDELLDRLPPGCQVTGGR